MIGWYLFRHLQFTRCIIYYLPWIFYLTFEQVIRKITYCVDIRCYIIHNYLYQFNKYFRSTKQTECHQSVTSNTIPYLFLIYTLNFFLALSHWRFIFIFLQNAIIFLLYHHAFTCTMIASMNCGPSRCPSDDGRANIRWLMSNLSSVPFGINFSKQTAIDNRTANNIGRFIRALLHRSPRKTWEYANLIKILNARELRPHVFTGDQRW